MLPCRQECVKEGFSFRALAVGPNATVLAALVAVRTAAWIWPLLSLPPSWQGLTESADLDG
jgi:hypothetical protein